MKHIIPARFKEWENITNADDKREAQHVIQVFLFIIFVKKDVSIWVLQKIQNMPLYNQNK
ncbi:hypothetical protein CW304_09780 [Bacillus sp. UFRGS-B20]|nr:hypothetical protein CW304_09780 [Bacillus sp. UFRGS-B20]